MNAVGIKRLLYADPSKVTGDLTPAMLKSILEDAETEEVTNVHQDTWSIGWKRSRTYEEIHKCLMALTEDDVWAVFPKGSVVTREVETDGATGLAVVGTAMEPGNEAISTEYWYYDKEVRSSSGI